MLCFVFILQIKKQLGLKMFRKLFSLFAVSLLSISSFLSGAIEYEIQDIGTLQTHSSEAIAINNQGEILGWYNVDGTNEEKHYFLREKNGTFHELPKKEPGKGTSINWRYLTNNGKVYGTFDGNVNFPVLYVWDQANGAIKLGTLPWKEIAAVNDLGQVLIKSKQENENGKTVIRPLIWYNGQVTKLYGLEGDLGIESEESYGYDMNNKGEVVGQSLVSITYKNKIFQQVHAVKWVNGKALDLHNKIPKTNSSKAIAINNLGEVLLSSEYGAHLLREDGEIMLFVCNLNKLNDCGYVYNYNYDYGIPWTKWQSLVRDRNNKEVYSETSMDKKIKMDRESIWNKSGHVISVNEKGEIITQGETIYGEKHAMLLTPAEKN